MRADGATVNVPDGATVNVPDNAAVMCVGGVCEDCGAIGPRPLGDEPVFHDGCEFGRGFGIWRACGGCTCPRCQEAK